MADYRYSAKEIQDFIERSYLSLAETASKIGQRHPFEFLFETGEKPLYITADNVVHEAERITDVLRNMAQNMEHPVLEDGTYIVDATIINGNMCIRDICPSCGDFVHYNGVYRPVFECPHCGVLHNVAIEGD